MKPSLVLKMGQQLTMTPQLQQAIRLLQLSTLDLQQEIQEALDSNPMLEREEDGDDFDGSDPMAEAVDHSSDAGSEKISTQESTMKSLRTAAKASTRPTGVSAFPASYRRHRLGRHLPDQRQQPAEQRRRRMGLHQPYSSGVSLQSHLLWQLNLAPMSDTDRLIATTLIDCINDQGYLEESLQEIVDSFDPELEIELDEVEVVLRRVQQFEPAGIGARIARMPAPAAAPAP